MAGGPTRAARGTAGGAGRTGSGRVCATGARVRAGRATGVDPEQPGAAADPELLAAVGQEHGDGGAGGVRGDDATGQPDGYRGSDGASKRRTGEEGGRFREEGSGTAGRGRAERHLAFISER